MGRTTADEPIRLVRRIIFRVTRQGIGAGMTEPYDQQDNTQDSDDQRRPYRPPVGMPLHGEGRWGAPFSVAVHVLLILVLITPLFASVIAPELLPGGGPGPAGGGGGG